MFDKLIIQFFILHFFRSKICFPCGAPLTYLHAIFLFCAPPPSLEIPSYGPGQDRSQPERSGQDRKGAGAFSHMFIAVKLSTRRSEVQYSTADLAAGAQLDILLLGGLVGNSPREARKFFLPPPKHFQGGQEKCVLYSNNKKTNLTNRIFSKSEFMNR